MRVTRMTEVRRKYRVSHVHYNNKLRTILLCLESTEKISLPPTFMAPTGSSDEEKMVGKMMQTIIPTLQGMMPYQEENLLKIEISLEEYEKLGKPGILDEVTLTLDFIKEIG